MADLHIHTLTVRNHRITCDSPVEDIHNHLIGREGTD